MNSTIVFSGSKLSEQIAISTSVDELLEQMESFSVQVIHDRSEANVLLLPAQSTVLIVDNNSKLQVSRPPYHILCLVHNYFDC